MSRTSDSGYSHYFGSFCSGLSTRSFSQWGHRSGGGLMKMFKIACRIAGMLGCGGGPPTLFFPPRCFERSEEHTSELQSLMRISYAVFCLKKNKLQQSKSVQ